MAVHPSCSLCVCPSYAWAEGSTAPTELGLSVASPPPDGPTMYGLLEAAGILPVVLVPHVEDVETIHVTGFRIEEER